MAQCFDIIVVGAGPAGSAAAREAARLGCGSVLLLDQNAFPRDKTCAGGLSVETCGILKELGLWEAVACEAYPIMTLKLRTPNGKELVLPVTRPATVLNRARLDEILADAAVRSGVRFHPGTKVDGLLQRDGCVVGVRCGNEEVAARWVIAANGGQTRFNLDPRPPRLFHTCMARFEGASFTANVAEVAYEPEPPAQYGWLFPESDSRANLGVSVAAERLGGRSIRDVFERFLQRRYGRRLAGATQVGAWKGHPIRATVSIRHRAMPGVLLVGEANRLVNIATGEGILYAIMSGVLAARAIGVGQSKGLDAAGTAALYASSLRRSLALRFQLGHLYRKVGMRMLGAVATIPPNALLRRLVLGALIRL